MSKKARQKVIIVLSNGKKGVFEGTAIAWPDEVHDVLVSDVVFQVPTTANPANVTPPKEEKKPEPEQPKEPPTPPPPPSTAVPPKAKDHAPPPPPVRKKPKGQP